MLSVTVFVFKVEHAFDLLVCERTIKMCSKPVKLFSLEINVLLSFSFLFAVRELDENLPMLFNFNGNSGIRLSSSGGSCRKVFTVLEITCLVYPAFRKAVPVF